MVYMSIQFNDDAIRKLGAQVAGNVGAEFQPGFDDFQAQWLGKPAPEVVQALSTYIATTPLRMTAQEIDRVATEIANGVTVKLTA